MGPWMRRLLRALAILPVRESPERKIVIIGLEIYLGVIHI